MALKILTYNVNGIRAAQKKGLFDWIIEGGFDIVCLQETKAMSEQVDISQLREAGYEDYWFSAEKKGYSGVLTLTKLPPQKVEYGMGHEAYDREGRLVALTFDSFKLINCYFPSGTSGEERHLFKMGFLENMMQWAGEQKRANPNLILVGDYNIAHTPNDIHDPVRNKNSSGFKPEEREWMTRWLESGWVDTFRHANPELIEYSWWSYRAKARANNKGWRIDYQCVTEPLGDKIIGSKHLSDGVHSDHCGLVVDYNL